VVPSIKHLHDWGGSIKEKEFEKWSNKMDPSQKEILHEALNSMLGKFLHPPSDGIRKMADEGLSREAVFYLSKFFPLEEET
jgi:glutamyl-tRNA reductase